MLPLPSGSMVGQDRLQWLLHWVKTGLCIVQNAFNSTQLNPSS
jgi:hypothetical protein